MPKTKNVLAAAALATAFAGLAATTAQADSIAYVKGGDVWLTPTDASREYQVTFTGGYDAVAQADDGTLLGTTIANHLRRLDRQGNVLSDISTPVSTNPQGSYTAFSGPFDTDISPDGKTAAYGFYYSALTQTRIEEYNGAGFTRSDQLTGFTDQGYKYSKDWDAPDFIDNSTVIVSSGPGYPSTNIAIEKIGSGDPVSWFSDGNHQNLADATMSRNKLWVAALEGTRHTIVLYRVGDRTPGSFAQLAGCYTLSDEDGVDEHGKSDASVKYSYSSPTMNADGTLLVWATGRGLAMAPIGDASAGCPDGKGGKAVLPGAKSPDWGPADVPAARPNPTTQNPATQNPGSGGGSTTTNTAPAPTTTNPATSGGGGAQVQPAPQPAPPVTSAGFGLKLPTVKLASALSKGIRVNVTAPAAGRVTVSALAGATKVATGSATASGAGNLTVTVKFTKAAAKRYKKSKKLALKVTAALGAETTTSSITLKK